MYFQKARKKASLIIQTPRSYSSTIYPNPNCPVHIYFKRKSLISIPMPFKSSPTSDLDQIALKLTHRIKSNSLRSNSYSIYLWTCWNYLTTKLIFWIWEDIVIMKWRMSHITHVFRSWSWLNQRLLPVPWIFWQDYSFRHEREWARLKLLLAISKIWYQGRRSFSQ